MEERKRHPKIEELKARLESHQEERQRRLNQPKGPVATRFTTDYAVLWGRRQGWALIEREGYDARTRRHRDLEGAVDAIFDSGVDRVGVQGAGIGERAAHWTRFVAWGKDEDPVAKARRRGLRIAYVEFARGDKEPSRLEWWA